MSPFDLFWGGRQKGTMSPFFTIFFRRASLSVSDGFLLHLVVKIDEDDGFPPPDPHRLVNLIRVWPGWFFLVLAWFGHWLLLLLGAQISGLDPPAHILSVKGAAVENRPQKRPKKEKKRRMQKMSQIPESLTAGRKKCPRASN